MQRLQLRDAFRWSAMQAGHELASHAYFFVRPEGNLAVDPLPLSESERAEVRDNGGISRIVLTSADHLRDAMALREEFGARIVTSASAAEALQLENYEPCVHGQEISPGVFVIALADQKTPGQFALHLREERAVVAGDAVFGAPAGALSLLKDSAYASVERAALGLRRILCRQPQTLLVAHGSSLYANAHAALAALIRARAGPAAVRINLDELEYDEYSSDDGRFRSSDAEVGFYLGAEKLGYQVVTLPPGARFCPLHSHAQSEELYLVLEGEPSVRMQDGTIACRRGDFIAFPTGEIGAHQLCNESSAPATVLLLGHEPQFESCYYPDSDKVLVIREDGRPFVRGMARLMVRGSPTLTYFDGE